MARWLLLLVVLLTVGCVAPTSSGGNRSSATVQPTDTSAPPNPSVSASPQARRPSPTALPEIPVPGEPALVVNVIDGDTLTVRTEHGEAIVRLIGIDAPERGDQDRPAECFFEASTAALAQLTPPGSTVYLERDVSETDRYGRLLRYVWIVRARSWLLVNEELVRQGAAIARQYPPDVRYSDRLAAAQRDAQRTRAGLWGACTSSPTSSPPAPPPQAGCDPSYPDICLPPPPPDLDCRDIPYRRFRVLPPDSHRLDSDRDGIGCEAG
ncbi:Thermonuclease [bacterium HR28]|nr:Thermonuclease [bacterium HR28]